MALTGLRGRRSHLKSEDARSLYPTMLCTRRKASRKLLCPHDVDDKLILLGCLFHALRCLPLPPVTFLLKNCSACCLA